MTRDRYTITGVPRRFFRALAVSTAFVAALLPAAAHAAGSTGGTRARVQATLATFDSCDQVVGYAQAHASRTYRRYYRSRWFGYPQPLTGPPVPRPPGGPYEQIVLGERVSPGGDDDSSRTNVQEADVDEPDVVKNDGRHIYAVVSGSLHAIDTTGGAPRLIGSVDLPDGGVELLVAGDRALIVGTRWRESRAARQASAASTVVMGYAWHPQVIVTEVDLRDPRAMRVLATQAFDGEYVSARLTGSTARVIVNSRPAALADWDGELDGHISSWLPSSSLKRGSAGGSRRLVTPCRRVRRALDFSGLDTVTVATFDMERGLPAVDADTIMADADTVYASAGSLYVTAEQWVAATSEPDAEPPSIRTMVHRFDTSRAGETTYAASGELRGAVLNQFSLSEYKGVLRVATTDTPPWWNGSAAMESESFVTTLAESHGRLTKVGQVGGLGKGERIYAVRFIGERGYVVTFRQTDPLYTLDLSDPAVPHVVGELKIPGYSAYLHPLGDDLMLGVGQDASDAGRRLGTQVALFDVSDLSHPQRLQVYRMSEGSSYSEAESDHHAFLWWAKTGMAMLPVDSWGTGPGSTSFRGAVALEVRRNGISELGRVAHTSDVTGVDWNPGIRRALVVGGRLFTVSDFGIEAHSLEDLTPQGWVGFPQRTTP